MHKHTKETTILILSTAVLASVFFFWNSYHKKHLYTPKDSDHDADTWAEYGIG